jgi:hypothetical protein
MAKGKDLASCTAMNTIWTLMPHNMVLQIIVGIYNIIFGFVKTLRKIINHTLYYLTIILIIIFKGINLTFIAKFIRFIADQFIIADTPWNKRMKNCKKIGKLGKKINVKKFKRDVEGAFGAVELERDPDDVIEEEEEEEEEEETEPSGRYEWSSQNTSVPESSAYEDGGDKSMMYSILTMGAVFLGLYFYIRNENNSKIDTNTNQM